MIIKTFTGEEVEVKKEEVEEARRNGLFLYHIVHRIERGWTVEETIKTPSNGKRQARLTQLTAEQRRIARSRGITNSHITNRLRLNWTIEEAITVPVKKRPIGKRITNSLNLLGGDHS